VIALQFPTPKPLKGPLADKTRTFHDQIEVKQKELQPWTIKSNEKQAAIDLAKSERETLARKSEAAREAKAEAEATKTRLQGEKEAKVRLPYHFNFGT
jgi:structural maintenance of chromosome 4